MKISVDAGGLCAKINLRFGNYTFSRNLLKAIEQYDKSNEYFMYSFCSKPEWLGISNNFHYKVLHPRTFWLSSRVTWEELKLKKDIFLALNQAIPLATKSKIISFSHGLSYYFYPQYYSDSYYAFTDQLKSLVKKSELIIVSSRRVKMELIKIYPKNKNFVVINYGIPFDMLVYKKEPREKFFLYVGMDYPIKNIEFLVECFKKFRSISQFGGYSLYLVGNLKRFEDKNENIISLTSIQRDSLRKLYSTATAYLTTSFYESFNFPVLEALSQKCQVVGLKSAIIPEFRDLVFLAEDQNDFVAKMEEVSTGKGINIDVKSLKEQFSWKKYVTKLVSLYKI
ncbi:glycosyltransferase [Candidatus Roizmanbacteria bacterium]|nr:glycosyltransferase [Candidatus Roizmanbacteria bacterium]